jgi:hypothetical protein
LSAVSSPKGREAPERGGAAIVAAHRRGVPRESKETKATDGSG